MSALVGGACGLAVALGALAHPRARRALLGPRYVAYEVAPGTWAVRDDRDGRRASGYYGSTPEGARLAARHIAAEWSAGRPGMFGERPRPVGRARRPWVAPRTGGYAATRPLRDGPLPHRFPDRRTGHAPARDGVAP